MAKTTNLPLRTIQFWTTESVLQPTAESRRRGPGKHRRYSYEELQIAAILAEIQNFQLRVGALQSLAAYLRDIFKAGEKLGYSDPDLALRHLDEIRNKKRKSNLTLADRIRLDQWAQFERAKNLKGTVALLGIYFKVDGTCEAEVFGEDSDNPLPARPVGELLLDHASGLIISVGNVFDELEGRLEELA